MNEPNQSEPIDVQKHVKTYITILVSLLVLTLATVGISQITATVTVRITIAVVLAMIQGFLSVGYLMHLNAERKFIYWVLLLTIIFFVVLVFLPLLTVSDSISRAHVS